MNTLLSIARAILNMSIEASIILPFILVIRLILKKSPKVISYTLWVVLFLRLIVPFSIASDISIFNAIKIPETQYGYATLEYSNESSTLADNSMEANSVTPTPLDNEYKQTPKKHSTEHLLSLFWLLGFIVMNLYYMIGHFKLKRTVSDATRKFGNVYESDKIGSAFTFGFLRPNIYMPTYLDSKAQQYVILHEQKHIIRKDHLVKQLAFVVLSVHWFNPLIWIAFHLMCKDMEMSCDELVINETGHANKKEYCDTLLKATSYELPSTFSVLFANREVKSRVRNILKYKKQPIIITVVILMLILPACVVLATDPIPVQTSDSDQESEEPTVQLENNGPNPSTTPTPEVQTDVVMLVGEENAILIELDNFQDETGEYVFPETTWGMSRSDIEAVHGFTYVDPMTTRPDRTVWIRFEVEDEQYAGILILTYDKAGIPNSINVSLQRVPNDSMTNASKSIFNELVKLFGEHESYEKYDMPTGNGRYYTSRSWTSKTGGSSLGFVVEYDNEDIASKITIVVQSILLD